MTRFIKFLPLTFLLAVFSLNATGQTYEPAILILSPYKTTIDKELKKEKILNSSNH